MNYDIIDLDEAERNKSRYRNHVELLQSAVYVFLDEAEEQQI